MCVRRFGIVRLPEFVLQFQLLRWRKWKQQRKWHEGRQPRLWLNLYIDQHVCASAVPADDRLRDLLLRSLQDTEQLRDQDARGRAGPAVSQLPDGLAGIGLRSAGGR